MRDLEGLLSGKDREKLRSLADSPEARQLGSMIDPAAAEKAAKAGDVEALRGMMAQIMRTAEGRKLAESISKAMGK